MKVNLMEEDNLEKDKQTVFSKLRTSFSGVSYFWYPPIGAALLGAIGYFELWPMWLWAILVFAFFFSHPLIEIVTKQPKKSKQNKSESDK